MQLRESYASIPSLKVGEKELSNNEDKAKAF
jgi:hypothetical protein